MIRKLAVGLGLAAGAAGLAGCNGASSAGKEVAVANANATDMMKTADAEARKKMSEAEAEKRRLADEANFKAAEAAKKGDDLGKKVEDAAKDGAKKVEDGAKKAGGDLADFGKGLFDKGKEMLGDKAKEETLKPISDLMPKIEDKIKGLTGPTQAEAQEKYTAFKKLVEEFKAAPVDKTVELGGKLKTAFDELRKKIGL